MSSTTLTVATCNAFNLALPNRPFYSHQAPYSQHEYERKIDWLGGRLNALGADVMVVQEVWDEGALQAAVSRSGMRHMQVRVPGAETAGQAQGTPLVGIVSRLPIESLRTVAELPQAVQIVLPGGETLTHFSRPVVVAQVRMKHGLAVNVVGVHPKSKRPKFLTSPEGEHLEDRQDPSVIALAQLRAMMVRGAEAVGIRQILVDLLQHNDAPLVLMGDLNDRPHAVSTQMMAFTNEIEFKKRLRDVALFNAWEVQGEAALKRDVAYSHIHQGWPELLDHIFVSEEFVATSPFCLGDVRRVDAFNDHLHEGRSRHTSDHGLVRAVIRVFTPDAPEAAKTAP